MKTSVKAGNMIWVDSKDATLKKEMKAALSLVADVEIGTELTVLQVTEKWYRVSTSTGQVGWIYNGKVSAAKPIEHKHSAVDNLSLGSSTIGFSDTEYFKKYSRVSSKDIQIFKGVVYDNRN
jgi:uncharacterized protein YgiM (DUF1202 family)